VHRIAVQCCQALVEGGDLAAVMNRECDQVGIGDLAVADDAARGTPRVSSSMRSGAPVAVAATTARSASAICNRLESRRDFFTDLNMRAVARRTAMKSGWRSSS